MVRRVDSMVAMMADTTGGKSGVMKADAISVAQSADRFTVAGMGWLTAADMRTPTFLPAPATGISGQPGITTAGSGFREPGASADGLALTADTPTDAATGTTGSWPSAARTAPVAMADLTEANADAANLRR